MTTPQDALPAPASGEIAVTISLPWTIGVSIKPNVLLDGVRMVNAAGRNVYPVAPGRHMLSCEVNVSGSTFGQGDIAVDVQPGATTEVYYAAPLSANLPGRLGLTPQTPYRGGAAGCILAAVIGFLVLFVFWVVIGGFLAVGRR
ncbi:MAG TPA: hypothetical protein PLZ83_13190 [Dermatophilaceae bacterium]|jgi:hypothetical protein|uniref:Uncharacterized protein n=1 Tax=Candidatus Phosphoribacter hodrii TaxID=2953743 RepID=A0A934X5P9_9MICO|nr:hypothetical protein [Candidatus Phosphoribacter hodrii]OPZ51855.1 MAG: hypothetical protein BWY91_02560 [bacterium ADurb.BinA028]HOF36092.1 hypothetical protein [Dermatophilaceae bacterium]HOI04181.1 hypothetical protein [Dermatophilaceae bacterium]HOR15471.1 hypothetical protein [Dermatophilaceae bacterium]